MTLILCALLVWVLVRNGTAMAAAAAAARLFAQSVMPGLFPYMTLALLVTSRLPERMPEGLMVLLGWCGGSPAGARLLALRDDLTQRRRRRLAVSCATMSPMFLVGTIPQWTGSTVSGVYLLAASLLGGAFVGWMAGGGGEREVQRTKKPSKRAALSIGEAVEQASRTMLMICGTMMLLRVAAALAGECMDGTPALAVMTLLEVTSGTAELARLSAAPAVRIGLIGAATGFGGAAILLQNRACYPDGLFTLRQQVGWQALHGLVSGGLAWLLAVLFG